MRGAQSMPTGAVPSADAAGVSVATPAVDSTSKTLCKVAGVAALVAFSANVLDFVLGLGETDIIVNGTKTASEWFALYQDNWFKGLYVLGILNIVYMAALVPVYFAIFIAHRRANGLYAALAMIVSFIGLEGRRSPGLERHTRLGRRPGCEA
jgi:hypothetical protein